MDKSTKLEPLNMHGHANTWEEELLETARERNELRAENERLHQILGGMADLPTWAEEMGELQRENERLRATLTEIMQGARSLDYAIHMARVALAKQS